MALRIYDNNCAVLSSYSSQLAGYPASNLLTNVRSSSWRPSPSFPVSVQNEGYSDQYTHGYIDYNAGSGFSPPTTLVFVASGNYTGATLATAVKNALNARESNNWNVTYSSTTGLFTFTCTTSRTLRFYKSGNNYLAYPLSRALGMVIEDGTAGYSEVSGTSFTSLYPVFHSAEYLIFDMGVEMPVNTLILESKINEVLDFSPNVYIYLMADNMNLFTTSLRSTPSFVQRITYDKKLTNLVSGTAALTTPYRFWCLLISDPYSSFAVNNLDISKIYLGDYTEIESKCITNSFSPKMKDTSEKIYSENGALYSYSRPTTFDIGKINLQHILSTSAETLWDVYSRFGEVTPFFISIDPNEEISNYDIFCKYVYFDSEPVINHIIYVYYDATLSLKECI